MKKVTSSFLISALIMPHAMYGADLSDMTCSYADKYNQCVQANEDGWARSIDDFVCIEQKWGWEKMLLQIILDEKFSELDEEVEEYLDRLEKDKDAYFGNEPQANFLTAIDDITSNFSEYWFYWQEYHKICNETISEELFTCIDKVSNVEISSFLDKGSRGQCESLFETKLDIYRQVAYNILKINRLAIRKDDRKTYVIDQRDKYSWVMQLMLNILWYLERIVNGWPTKTKHPST